MKKWVSTTSNPCVFICFVLLLGGCRPGNGVSSTHVFLKPDRPESSHDVLLITIDTWRYDAWGAESSVKTPHIDQLASEGLVFTNSFAHAVVTLPSHASILTGLFPHEHGLRDNAGFRLDDGIETMATHFKRNGYETAAFISAFPLDSRYGLHRGFDLYGREKKP